MPKPMVCLSVALCQFAEGFRPYFSERQWKYFVIVLLGLVECEGRRTLRGLLSTVGESVSVCGLSIDEAPHDRFGSALATGDFNRDGFSDLAIGAPKVDLGTIRTWLMRSSSLFSSKERVGIVMSTENVDRSC